MRITLIIMPTLEKYIPVLKKYIQAFEALDYFLCDIIKQI